MKRKLSRRDLIKASGVAGGLAHVLPAAGFAVAAAEAAPQAGPGPRLIMQYPSNLWREALVAGNGKFGAAVYGSIHLERILFNHEDLWDYAEATGQPDVGSLLPQARRLLMQYPSNLWREALVAGNGKFGAAVYGSIHLERILFNHEDLWDYAEATGQPDVGSL